VSEEKQILLNVRKDEQSASTTALFSNFLQISRVATEVQFEFIFVDINEVATTLQKAKESDPGQIHPVIGRTVAKVVLPGLSLMQAKEHIYAIFAAIEKELGKLPDAKEVQHGSGRVVAG
jgi:hypothetical protein